MIMLVTKIEDNCGVMMAIIEVMEMDDDKYDGVTLVTKQG